jgi:hypothetical protein
VQCTVCLADSQFGARALAQISKCAEYLSDDARTTGGGGYDLRSMFGVWYHRTFTNGMRFQVGLVSL